MPSDCGIGLVYREQASDQSVQPSWYVSPVHRVEAQPGLDVAWANEWMDEVTIGEYQSQQVAADGMAERMVDLGYRRAFVRSPIALLRRTEADRPGLLFARC